MKQFKHLLVALCIASLAVVSFGDEAHADDSDIGIGGILSYQVDADDHGFGALNLGVDGRVGIDLGGLDLIVNPQLLINPDTITDFTIFFTGVNFLFAPDLDLGVDVYGGPGLAVVLAFDDFFDTVTLGANFVAGASFDLDMPVAPFAQLRFNRFDIADGGHSFLLEVGAHFGL